MKTFIFLFLIFFKLNILSASDSKKWILVWYDEFNEDEINLAKWNVEEGDLNKNNEQQYYKKDEVYQQNGFLYLRSRKKKYANKNYTSGLVDSKHKFSQKFGRFEIRAKIPKGQGIWPAIWLMNASERYWPPEIDIVEFLGHTPKVAHMTVHYGRYPDNQFLTKSINQKIDFSQDFHVYAIEWNEKSIKWFIDGKEVFQTTKHVPDNIDFYLILNTAVGGDWPGFPDHTTKFPVYHVIDYVRIYKKDQKDQKFLTTTSHNGIIYKEPAKGLYRYNEKVQIFAKGNIGYKFDSWKGDIKSYNNPVSIHMNTHKIVEARFIEDKNYEKIISTNKPVFSSSNENENCKAAYANDDNINTRWSSKFTDPQYLTIDLKKKYRLKAIKILWEKASAKYFNIEISNDNKIWKTIFTEQNNNSLTTELILEKNHTARYVRIYCIKRNTKWGYSIYSFNIYGQ